MPRPCAPGEHTFRVVGKKKTCAKCALVPCASELDHAWSVHPEHKTLYPPTYDKICRKCGERRVWNPGAGATMNDPHVLAHDHDEQAKKFGHPLHEPTPEAVIPGEENLPPEYRPVKRTK